VKELKRIIAEKDEIEDTAVLFEGMSLKQKEMYFDTEQCDKVPEKKEVRMIEKMQEMKAKKDPITIQPKKGAFKPFR
jgi:hypothetical protein